MLECLPNRCVPESSLQSPQTEPGYDQSYIADVQIIASDAQVAQEIIRDIYDLKCRLPNLLNDFRSKDFIIDALSPNSGTSIQDYNLRRQQPFLMRIHELVEDFDRQCYDAVHRMRLRISTKKGAEQAAEARQCIQDRREKKEERRWH